MGAHDGHLVPGHLCAASVLLLCLVQDGVDVRMVDVNVTPRCRVGLACSRAWDWLSSLSYLVNRPVCHSVHGVFWGQITLAGVPFFCGGSMATFPMSDFPFTSFRWN